MPGPGAFYNYKNVAAGTATTLVRTGSGILQNVIINTKGASSNTLTIYDGVSAAGTKIATIDTTVANGNFPFGVWFKDGLTLVSATGTGADYTVTWSMQ